MPRKDDFEPVRIGTRDAAADGVEVRVSRDPDGGRRAAILPRAMDKLGQDGVIMAADIQRTVLGIQKLQQQLEQQIEEARDLGMSWNSIGWCVGTTGDAARQRWGVDRG